MTLRKPGFANRCALLPAHCSRWLAGNGHCPEESHLNLQHKKKLCWRFRHDPFLTGQSMGQSRGQVAIKHGLEFLQGVPTMSITVTAMLLGFDAK